jgi:5-methylcytosine-specific restriction endonuclease McrA
VEKMNFPETKDQVFEEGFLSMTVHGRKSNTYKFAFAKFLLEYCNQKTVEEHVEFSTIAKYFLEFFWPQVCKTKLNHAPRYTKKSGIKEPEIIEIIKDQFSESWYPKNYTYYEKQERIKIQNCISDIPEKCFNDVVWRFQKINNDEPDNPLFFKYKVEPGWNDPNKKKTDLTFGIYLNSEFIKFVKEKYVLLSAVVILEWARFLEKYNHDVPLIIPKLEGSKIKRDTAYSNKAKKELEEAGYNECFYCKIEFSNSNKVHLEHVIPFDYISEDNIWNYALACQRCNCHKSGFLPPEEFIDKLIKNITKDKFDIPMLKDSLNIMGDNFAEIIKNHYNSAKRLGYAPKDMPPNSVLHVNSR